MNILRVFCFIIFIATSLCTAQKTFAAITINEIAWMGTITSTNDEWIELFNNGTNSVVLDGWTLKAFDGSPTINLSGTLSANSYMLLERTDDTTVPDIPAGVIYSGALGNTGEKLMLENNIEEVIDTVDMASGWIAGDATTKETMQKKGNEWITGTPTPGSQNVLSGTTNPSDTSNDSPTETASSATVDEKEDQEIYIKPESVYSARMVIPEIIIQENPVTFESVVKKDRGLVSLSGRFEWTMGDGGGFVFDRSTPFHYTYHQPGTYIVILKYYSDVFREKPDTIHKQTIIVIPAAVQISIDRNLGVITLTNNSSNDLDIGSWKLQSGNDSFIFPLNTILTKKEPLNIPFQVHKLSDWSKRLFLLTPTGYNSSYSKTTALAGYAKTSEIITTPEPVNENLFEPGLKTETIDTTKNKAALFIWPLLLIFFLTLTVVIFALLGKKVDTSD